jgi:hypothetical protein
LDQEGEASVKAKKIAANDTKLQAYDLHTKAFLATFRAYVETQWGPRCSPPNTPLDPKDACGTCVMWDLYDQARKQVK